MVEVYFSWHFPGVERLKRLPVQSASDIVTPLRYLKLELRSSSGTASKHQYNLYRMEEHDPTVRISASLCGRRNGRLDDFGWSRHCICEAPGGLIDESCFSSPVPDPCLGPSPLSFHVHVPFWSFLFAHTTGVIVVFRSE